MNTKYLSENSGDANPLVTSLAPSQSSLTLSLRSEVDSRRLLERDLDLDLEWLGAYKDSFMVHFTAVPKKYNLDKMC